MSESKMFTIESIEGEPRVAELETLLAAEKEQRARWYKGAVELGAKVELLQAQLREANARADIWERDYTNCDSSPLNEYRKRAEKAEKELAEAKHDVMVRGAIEELKTAEARESRLRAALETIRLVEPITQGDIASGPVEQIRQIKAVAGKALEVGAPEQGAKGSEVKG